MKIKDSFFVKLSREDLFLIFKNYSLNSFEKCDISGITGVNEPKYISIYLEKFEDSFKLYFKCQKIPVLKIGLPAKKTIDLTFEFQKQMVMEIIIDTVLKDKNINKAANLNTPYKNIVFTLGSLSKGNKEEIIFSFDFNLKYDDPNDYQ